MSKKQRLQKVIAASGYTSRRKAEQLIIDKRVKVNGEIVSELGSKVSLDDEVYVDDTLISKEKKVYYLINKPKGVLSSVSDDRNRKVIVDLIDDTRRIYPVGRLDLDTTGLLMLTNDGNFTNAMIHPSYEVEKVYKVRVDGYLNKTKKDKLETGVSLDGEMTLPAKVKFVDYSKKKDQSIVLLKIREGKNRQVKRMFKAVGLKVLQLHRQQVAFLKIDGLKIGEYRRLSEKEVKDLLTIAKEGKENEK